ncbi:MAG: hypothetical protein ACJ8F7_08445 [Gemmataceae bacterium]
MRVRLLIVAVLQLSAGCGGSEGPKFARVSGRVLLNGRPLPNAAVLFAPVGSKQNINPGPSSGGKTDADGRYTLLVSGQDTKGAVVGKHKVSITLIPEEDPADDRPKKHRQLPLRYHGKNTQLEFDVPPAGSDTADFGLTDP